MAVMVPRIHPGLRFRSPVGATSTRSPSCHLVMGMAMAQVDAPSDQESEQRHIKTDVDDRVEQVPGHTATDSEASMRSRNSLSIGSRGRITTVP